MPPQHTDPAGDVAQELLAAWWRELGNPVILSTGGWCPVPFRKGSVTMETSTHIEAISAIDNITALKPTIASMYLETEINKEFG